MPRLVALGALLLTSTTTSSSTYVGATRFFQADLAPVFDLDTGSQQAPIGELPKGGNVTYEVAMFVEPEHLPSDFVAIPIRAAPICVGYNKLQRGTLQPSLEDLGLLLTTDDAVTLAGRILTPTSGTNPVQVTAADVSIVLAREAPVNFALLSALLADGIEGFENVTLSPNFDAFPTAAQQNPRIWWVDSATDVVEALRGNTSVIGFLSLSHGSMHAEIMCASMSVEGPSGTIVLPPVLDPKQTSWLEVTREPETRIVHREGTEVFPLIGAVLAIINTTAACKGNREAETFVRDIVGDSTTSLALRMLQFGMIPLGPIEALVSLRQAAEHLCPSMHAIGLSGDDAALTVIGEMSQVHLENTEVLIAFEVDEEAPITGEQFVSMTTSRAVMGATAGGFRDKQQQAQYPTVRFIPFAAFYMSLLANIEGMRVSIVIPRCTLLRIATGDVQYWDDPELAKANLLVALPHERILFASIGHDDEFNAIVLRGLVAMLPTCQQRFPSRIISNVSAIVESYLWPLPASALRPDASDVLEYVHATRNSLAFVPFPVVNRVQFEKSLSVIQVSLEDEATKIRLQPSAYLVSDMLRLGSIDSEHWQLSVPLTRYDQYPFVGVATWMYDVDRKGNCSELRLALDFAQWSMTAAASVDVSQLFVAMPEWVSTRVSALIRANTRCDGALTYPLPKDSLSPAIIAVICIALVLAVAAAFLTTWRVCFRSSERDVSNAPQSSPFAIIFTDVESSTALWAHAPEIMGPALDIHSLVIRKQIAKHGAYEVKTIGDAFMIAVDSAEGAVALAMDIQEALQDADWGRTAEGASISTILQKAYEELSHQPITNGTTTISLPSGSQSMNINAGVSSTSNSQSLSRQHNGIINDGTDYPPSGLKVRIGVHFGEGEVKFDDVTKGYDYFGTTVNTASRIESAGHGGQTLISAAVMDIVNHQNNGGSNQTTNGGGGVAVTVNGLASKVQARPIGSYTFKGLDEEVNVIELLPLRFQHRRFPPLRDVNVPNAQTAPVGADGGRSFSSSSLETSGVDRPGAVAKEEAALVDLRTPGAASLCSNGGHNNNFNLNNSNQNHDEIFLQTFLSAFLPEQRRRLLRQSCDAWRIGLGAAGENVREQDTIVSLSQRVSAVARRIVQVQKTTEDLAATSMSMARERPVPV